jgi:hypothetical protein
MAPLATLEAAGWKFRADGPRLIGTPPAGTTEADRDTVRSHKAEILAALAARADEAAHTAAQEAAELFDAVVVEVRPEPPPTAPNPCRFHPSRPSPRCFYCPPAPPVERPTSTEPLTEREVALLGLWPGPRDEDGWARSAGYRLNNAWPKKEREWKGLKSSLVGLWERCAGGFRLTEAGVREALAAVEKARAFVAPRRKADPWARPEQASEALSGEGEAAGMHAHHIEWLHRSSWHIRPCPCGGTVSTNAASRHASRHSRRANLSL